MDTTTAIITIITCLFGSGSLLLWLLNRITTKHDEKDSLSAKVDNLTSAVSKLQDGLVMTLENDAVIFKALREHSINGESEAQEQKMDSYFRELGVRGK